jgi:hypothetical protein
MKFYHQFSKRNCGQIAVAAITERPVKEIEAIVGHNHGTSTKELIRALEACGFSVLAKRCSPHTLPTLGLAQVHNTKPGWHWVAIGDGRVWDGTEAGAILLSEYRAIVAAHHNGRLTSFLPVSRPAVTACDCPAGHPCCTH